jgi:chemotaxis protein MotB
VTIMLSFFVLMVSFANTDSASFQSVAGSVRQAFGATQPASKPASPGTPSTAPGAPQSDGAPAPEVDALARVRQYLEARGLMDAVEVAASARGVVLRAKDRVLFDSGDAELRSDGLPLLDTVKALAGGFDGELAIEGHTDERPINTGRFPSNWELSGARASAVLRYLVEQGLDPARVYVAGYADMRPIVENTSDENRARNRRVEFVFQERSSQTRAGAEPSP